MSERSANKEFEIKSVTPRAKDYAQWYNDLVLKSGLADYSAVRGCMVIKPYGYALWENIQRQLDQMFKETGHQNAYFPLFVPKSFLEKEEGHAEGFAKECAVVTHYRLKNDPQHKGKLMVDPEAKLEEELVVRPTSEAVIWNTFKSWIRSYRDLPLLINQWANIVRWEMRTRLFLRTTEFLWQEGHTAHATREEAIEEARRMLHVYADFAEHWLALPVLKGVKTAAERFAGAEDTYCIEVLVQDGKAIQAGTSHFLGQNFAKAFDVTFTNRNNQQEYVWATSWGVSTRLIGTIIMAHGDDHGLILPPRVAPIQLVIIPIARSSQQLEQISQVAHRLKSELTAHQIRVRVDDDPQQKPGWKFTEYELRGVPLRIAIGPRDLEQNTVELARRDTLTKEIVPMEGLSTRIQTLLDDIHHNMYRRVLQFREAHTTYVQSYDEFKKVLTEKGGFIVAHWDGTTETELAIKEETKATIRCIPLDQQPVPGKCIYSGKPSHLQAWFAIAY
ncbi:MAG: proline--tRNA ligase [Chitinophagales bacterium]|nr:proline--tRNA ligase [Chitinophagales bacterium]MDW8428533.1 proline--tRNA ligase [Chitinophagales bacterium]